MTKFSGKFLFDPESEGIKGIIVYLDLTDPDDPRCTVTDLDGQTIITNEEDFG